MGMFDSLIIKCPRCRADVEFQTKAGDCTLERYRATDNIPADVAASLLNDSTYCRECGNYIKLHGHVHVHLYAVGEEGERHEDEEDNFNKEY